MQILQASNRLKNKCKSDKIDFSVVQNFRKVDFIEGMQNLMCEEKRSKIRLIKAGNVVNSGAMDKFSNPPAGGRDFALFNLCKGFCKSLF